MNIQKNEPHGIGICDTMCKRQFVKDDLDMQFAIATTSLAKSFHPWALFNNNSFLLDPWPGGPPCKYCLYIVDYLKARM
jgi:hypothetical protein